MTKKKAQTGPNWGGARPGTGPKPKAPEQKAQKITISLDPQLLAWVDSLGPNRSQTIGQLLAASREQIAQE